MLALGIVSFLGLNINDQPEVNIPYVTITITLPGASPDQMESKVTKEVEESIGQLSGANHITSSVNEGYSVTVVEFDDSRNTEEASQDVRTKLSSIRGNLPDDISEPVIAKMDLNEQPILSLAVSGEIDPEDLSRYVDDTIVPELNTINGVGSVNAYGLLEREIQIKVDRDRLAAFHLTTAQVISALTSDNIDIPSGKVSDDNREITLRTYSSIGDIDGFEDIVITSIDGAEIHIGDVAKVIDGYQDRDSISYYDGTECIGIDLLKQSGTNTVEVADEIKAKVDSMRASMPAGIELHVVSDNSESIRASVSSVEETMIEGCILAVLVIFLFLQSFESTLISAVSLPTSIVVTFAAMKLMGFTLNTMSLMALSLSVGLLVDDSIVVIENIVRHLNRGKNPKVAAQEATSEISLAVLATTLTIVAVFLPMATMNGILGAFFKEFGLTIAFAVLISLFISFTLVPLMSARFLKKEEKINENTRFGKYQRWFEKQFEGLTEKYKQILNFVLVRRKKTIGITMIIFVLSLALIPVMGINFTPNQDNGTISLNAGIDAGTSLTAASEKAQMMEERVRQLEEVESVYTTVENTKVTITINLVDLSHRKRSSDQIASEIRNNLKDISGLDLSVLGSVSMSSSGTKAYSLHLQSDDFEQLLSYAQEAKQILAKTPGAVDVGISYKAGKPENRVVVDREKAADLGVAPTSISSAIRILYSGITVGQYDDHGDRIDVTVMDEDRTSLSNGFENVYVTSSSTGKLIPISQVTDEIYGTASSEIARHDKKRDIQLQANYVGVTSSELNKAFLAELEKQLPLPDGIEIVAGSDEEFMKESMGGMVQAIVLGILFIFLILAAQFESWLDPFVIMFSLPLALIGAMVSLFISGLGLTMIGLIGVVFLMGLVTKNAILLVDFIKKRREEGLDRGEAIIEAGMIRLRPILMTTFAMIFGMLPSAIATGIGSEMRQPMAVAIIGGLVTSTILTLVVIPVIYTILDDLKSKIKKTTKKEAV